MLANGLAPTTALPALDEASLPREVRDGTVDDRKLYATALGFERILVEALAENMTQTTSFLSEDEDSEDGSGSGLSFMKEQLPTTLASAVTGGGGLGLALELYRGMKRDETPSPTEPEATA
jgi:Rod binding domain-containing protein